MDAPGRRAIKSMPRATTPMIVPASLRPMVVGITETPSTLVRFPSTTASYFFSPPARLPAGSRTKSSESRVCATVTSHK